MGEAACTKVWTNGSQSRQPVLSVARLGKKAWFYQGKISKITTREKKDTLQNGKHWMDQCKIRSSLAVRI